jgi:uncharacterized RDD family membrane protein YckC
MRAWRKELQIETPEGISFPLMLADPLTRLIAFVIDLLVIQAVASLIGTATLLFGLISFDFFYALNTLIGFALALTYPMLLEWFWRGQTVGKRIMKLQVMDERGLHLRGDQVILRNLLRPVDALPLFYMVGGLMALFNRKAQRIGDFAAGTIVVQREPIIEPELAEILPDKYNSMRQQPHLLGRLHQRTSPREADLALQAILRRNQLDAEARLELYASLRRHFETKLTFPATCTEGLSDEHYLRNIVDILYRP